MTLYLAALIYGGLLVCAVVIALCLCKAAAGGDEIANRAICRMLGPGSSDERRTVVQLYPSHGRDAVAIPKKAPAPIATARGVTHRGEVDAHHGH